MLQDQELLHEDILLEGLKSGNQKIFDYLFHYYYSGLTAFAIKYIHNKEAAEDLVQEFFCKLWNYRENLHIKQTIKAYFFTSIKNRALDYLKHQQIENKFVEHVKLSSDKIEEYDFLVESELRDRINIAITKLPEKCRRIFIMNRFEGLAPKEIALKEDISLRTVETHIGKGIKLLRKELEPYVSASILLCILEKLNQY